MVKVPSAQSIEKLERASQEINCDFEEVREFDAERVPGTVTPLSGPGGTSSQNALRLRSAQPRQLGIVRGPECVTRARAQLTDGTYSPRRFRDSPRCTGH